MTSDAQLPFEPAIGLLKRLQTREVGARELLELYWSRVESFNPAINAIIADDMAAARGAADAADARRARGDALGPLDGLPMTVKESFDLAGLPTTWGEPAFKENIATRDSDVVKRLKAAGAVIFGKTNVPLMLSDWETFNEIHGTTNNPWDLARGPGGSSGGAAAALAAGLTGLEVGSDIGASIRNPAHYCGLFGHKATYGIISSRGQALPGIVSETDIAVCGPLARSAADLALALDVLAGAEGPRARAWRLELPPPGKTRLAEFKVAVMLSDPVAEVDQPVQDLIAKLADFLAAAGARVDHRARPDFDSDRAHRVYVELLRAATSRRQSDVEFEGNRARVEALAPDDQSYAARMLRGYTITHRDWLRVNEERHHLMLAWEAFFEDYDLLLCPAAASAAFPHDQKGERHERMISINGKATPVTDQLFWAGYSCGYYLPASVAPIGFTAEGLPVGVQIVGPRYADRSCIAFAELLEREYQAFVPPPAFAAGRSGT